MSEAAPERTSPPPEQGRGGFFARKIGPLPTWGWLALAAGGGAAYLWWRHRQGAAAAAAPSTGASGPAGSAGTSGGTDNGVSIAALQSEIEQLQGEVSKDAREDKGSGEHEVSGHGTLTGDGGPGKQGGGGTGPPTTEKGPYRHVSTGKESLTQVAKAADTSVASLLAVSRRAESAANLAELEAWVKHPAARRKGVVFYTENP